MSRSLFSLVLAGAIAGGVLWYSGCATSAAPAVATEEAGVDAVVPFGCLHGKLCNGTCIDPLSDNSNCNTCGHACGADFQCKAGSCVQVACDAPKTNCTTDGGAASCVDTSSDPLNCGACGQACSDSKACDAGSCVFDCPSPTVGCDDDAGGSCVDTTSDENNCGACGHVCPSAATCVASACSCPTGQALCGSSCVDTTSDDGNCGACGTSCGGSTQCVSSVCVSPPAESTVFVSSQVYQGGALSGLSGADATCQSLATAAKLKGSFRAWLSDSKTAASARFAHWSTPYVLVDGTKVASNWSGLTSGTLLHAIDETESGGAAPAGTIQAGAVWTNTNTEGTKYSSTDCVDWTSPSGTVSSFHFGNASSSAGAWTLDTSSSRTGNFCSDTAALYCISQ